MNRRFLLLLTLLLVVIVGLALAGGAGAAPQKARLAGSTPPWAKTANLKSAASGSQWLGFRVYLGWRDGAEAYATAVSNPASPSYGKYLTPAQFRQRFSPAPADLTAVKNWLAAGGFTLVYTPANGHYVSVEGTVAQAEAAFGVQLNEYAVKGQTLRAPATDLSVPASLAGVVSGVVGVDESAALVHPYIIRDAPTAPGFRNAPPLSLFWAQYVSDYGYPKGFTDVQTPATVPWTVKGYTPQQVKGAYNIPSSATGAGQTVAIIDAYASPTILADVNKWSTNRGLPTMTNAQLVQVVAPGTYRRAENKVHDPAGWWGEETLDVESVHGMAPAAKIVYVGSPNNFQDMDAAMNHVVDRHLASIVSNSYGWTGEALPKGFIKPFQQTLVQAAAEGIGVYFSSGDDGDVSSLTGYSDASWPASSPWVTAVGGTSLAVGQNNQTVFETGWGTGNYNADPATLKLTDTGWLYGGGGGLSLLFAEPWYQKEAGLMYAGRAVPDVAALGDPQTGLLVGQTQSFPDGTYYDEYRIGGTSLSCPVYAGLMALAQQKAGKEFGFANPLFYANPGAFRDILPVKTAVARRNFTNSVDATAGTADKVRTFDDYSGSPSQHTGKGWDDVTGLGVPNGIFVP